MCVVYVVCLGCPQNRALTNRSGCETILTDGQAGSHTHRRVGTGRAGPTTYSMAKHPHKLILFEQRTWRCALPGCTFFVHVGLAHILPGKQAVCWGCGDNFKVDNDSLKEEQPRCFDCRSDKDAMSRKIDKMLRDQGVTDVNDLPERLQEKIRVLREIKDIEPRPVTSPKIVEEDKPESEYVPPSDNGPKRTAAQQKEYEENWKLYQETVKKMGGQ
jgi:hypothetical protein